MIALVYLAPRAEVVTLQTVLEQHAGAFDGGNEMRDTIEELRSEWD